LSLLLTQNEGQISLDNFLGFLASIEQPMPSFSPTPVTAKEMQNFLSQITRNDELVKTPVFNEILLKLGGLGDREITEEFRELSPALQALRGGISGIREAEQQRSGFNSNGRGSDSREREERRMAYSGIHSDALASGAGITASSSFNEELQGYGARESLARQLNQKLIYSVKQGIHHLKMNLDPESLGRLDVELKVKGEKLTAHIRAENIEAYEALEKEVTALKESLAEAGLDLNLTLSFDGQDEKDRLFNKMEKNRFGVKSGIQSDEIMSDVPKILEANSVRLLDKVV
jgi:hypothetical protein